MDDWKTILSFFGKTYFQGRNVSFRECMKWGLRLLLIRNLLVELGRENPMMYRVFLPFRWGLPDFWTINSMWNQISQSCLGAKIPVGKGAKRKKTVWTSSISQFSSRRTKIKKLTEFLYLSQIIGSTRYSYIFLQHLCTTHPLVSFDIPPGIYLHQLVTRLNLRKFKEIHRLDGALHIFRFSSLFPQYRKLWPSILKNRLSSPRNFFTFQEVLWPAKNNERYQANTVFSIYV